MPQGAKERKTKMKTEEQRKRMREVYQMPYEEAPELSQRLSLELTYIQLYKKLHDEVDIAKVHAVKESTLIRAIEIVKLQVKLAESPHWLTVPEL